MEIIAVLGAIFIASLLFYFYLCDNDKPQKIIRTSDGKEFIFISECVIRSNTGDKDGYIYQETFTGIYYAISKDEFLKTFKFKEKYYDTTKKRLCS